MWEIKGEMLSGQLIEDQGKDLAIGTQIFVSYCKYKEVKWAKLYTKDQNGMLQQIKDHNKGVSHERISQIQE